MLNYVNSNKSITVSRMVQLHKLNACLRTILSYKLKTLELIFQIMDKYVYNNTEIQLIALKKKVRIQKAGF